MHNIESSIVLSEVQKYVKDWLIRISVANLISDIRWEVVWIINKKWLSYWKVKLSCVWWCAELYDRTFLENLWATDFEKNDVKFKIPIENVAKFLELTKWKAVPDFIESDPHRELREELSQEILNWYQMAPVLDESEVAKLSAHYSWTMFDSGFWMTESRPFVSIYIWRYFTLSWSKSILKRILESRVVHRISPKEYEAKRTMNWIYISPNVLAASELIYD
ncbi:MAG: hypothetical protein ACD_2C00141G0018 [uncultured bacterium (gcode 4)]|uniref:Uncharacterized protein n=1 Tax=uncultured bacterium (gcode 4) TaxID=1234023 RepID=K2FEI5_9BACT|nr:MAG: hypothetical protein ACD_2C00141G0018 [uncultured bacterium (gcode 4)]